ncbi:MAG TPA: hypothetical protein VED01_16710 [Burkholderiales bacterium]|nr:hypothetical protein [Burkholderiales bacterium]
MPNKPGFVERRHSWSFTVTGGRWVWSVVRPGGVNDRSAGTFDSLTECIEDATTHGYVPLKPVVDRRSRDREE